MYAHLGGTGRPGTAEGMAELLATHRLEDGKLTLNVFSAHARRRSEVGPHRNRADRLRRAAAPNARARVCARPARSTAQSNSTAGAGPPPRFSTVIRAIATAFRQLPAYVAEPDFADRVTRTVRRRLAPAAKKTGRCSSPISTTATTSRRMDVEFASGKPLPPAAATVDVAADRGWQSTGVRLEPGKKYRSAPPAAIRWPTAKPWICEPGGVTLRYYQGQPLGMLLAAVRSDDPAANNPSGLIRRSSSGWDDARGRSTPARSTSASTTRPAAWRQRGHRHRSRLHRQD